MATTPRTLLIAIVLFSLFMVASVAVMADLTTKYGQNNDQTYVNNYNQINSIATDMNTAQADLQASGATPVGFLEYISTGGIQTLKLMFNSGTLIKSITEDVGNRYNIPPIFISALMAIVVITVVWMIISAIFRIYQ